MPNLDIDATIQENIRNISQIIAERCAAVGRSADDIKLVAVSKQRNVREIKAALQAGALYFGENRVEETIEKAENLHIDQAGFQWHMIGHVQSRKARDVAHVFDVVHSVDSLKLANRLNRFAAEANRHIEILVQINTSGEDSKSGLPGYRWQDDKSQRQDIWALIEALKSMEHLTLSGLMTMAPYLDDVEATRPYFRRLRQLFVALQDAFPTVDWQELSMGMTNDYLIAIEEGATMLRVGRAIFGERSY